MLTSRLSQPFRVDGKKEYMKQSVRHLLVGI